MIYDPNKELTDTELSALDENEFFEYLDSKAKYLKQFTQPLGEYHTKQFMAMSKGGELTTDDLKKAKEIGRKGDDFRAENIRQAMTKLDLKQPDLNVKNHKTHRSQWFD